MSEVGAVIALLRGLVEEVAMTSNVQAEIARRGRGTEGRGAR